MSGEARPDRERSSFDCLRLRAPAVLAGLTDRTRQTRAPGALGPVLGRLGSLEVRLATTTQEIRRIQRLRFKVFYDEMSAVPKGASFVLRHDIDRYDRVCDHLLVLDHGAPTARFRPSGSAVVGTYRLLRQPVAARSFGFYAAREYDIADLTEAHPSLAFLELGRSCILEPYRHKRTIELLWRAIWAYVQHHRIDAMFGCASFAGVDPDRLALPLSFLHHYARAPDRWRVRALAERYVNMDLMPKHAISARDALHALPPLIKAYLRIGGSCGDGAVVDHQFGTTDVLVVVPVSSIGQRYIGHFGPRAG
jgi:L-ornithine Nalpha-acyltransferase